MAFRGIGDVAVGVIGEQKDRAQRGAQLTEQARQFDLRMAEERRQRAEQARQFDVSAGQRQAGMSEQARQFDVEQQAAAGQRDWQKGMAERQFTAEQGLAERKMDLANFGAQLSALTASADMQNRDADTQMKMAQLNQYLAATQEEERRRANRETLAKGALGSLALSAIANGGVMPTSAIEIANRELGDKDTRIVGGGVDPQSGVAFFQIRGPDGAVVTKNMPPENQYAVLQETYGDEVAKMFATRYGQNAAVSAAIARAQAAAQAKAAEKATVTPAQSVSMYQKAAENARKAAADIMDPKSEQKATLMQKAADYDAAAERIMSGAAPAGQAAPAPAAAGGEALTPELRRMHSIPPSAVIEKDKKTGSTVAYWYKDGKRVRMVFGAPR